MIIELWIDRITNKLRPSHDLEEVITVIIVMTVVIVIPVVIIQIICTVTMCVWGCRVE